MNKAAQQLGRLAKGAPKNYTAAEREKRSRRMREINAKRSAKAALNRHGSASGSASPS